MNVKELRDYIRDLPDGMQVMERGPDHDFHDTEIGVARAMKDPDSPGELCESDGVNEDDVVHVLAVGRF